MSRLIESCRRLLRANSAWVHMRSLQREGLRNVWHRSRIAPRILGTPPIQTAPFDERTAACEVRIMTWQKDYLAALWAAKSFYAYSKVDWPLIWHQGGRLSDAARQCLQSHFPSSQFVSTESADERVDAILQERGLPLCIEARRRSFMMRKLVDCLVLSRADYLLIMDSDILYFRRPEELLAGVTNRSAVSVYNRDSRNYYSITAESLQERYQLTQVDCLNAGLGLVCRANAPLDVIERFLADPDIYSVPWLTEQTIHAILASLYGVALLPSTYPCTLLPGLTTSEGEPLVSKHYPTHPRPLLYQEGMRHLISTGFLEMLRC